MLQKSPASADQTKIIYWNYEQDKDLVDFPILKGSVVTIGNFDGVHLGHRKLLSEVVTKSQELNIPSVVITFQTHTKEVTEHKEVPKIYSLEQNVQLIRSQRINYILVLDFNQTLAQTKPEAFLSNILLAKLHVQVLVIGYDFKFGQNKQGDKHFLEQKSKELDFQLLEIQPVRLDNEIVSSSCIRELLRAGETEKADRMLG